MKIRCASLALTLVLALGDLSASAAEWGTIKGRFVYDGPPPTPEKIEVTKDVEVCSLHPLIDESLLVSEEGGLANVAVFIRVPRGEKLEVHPDYAEAAEKPLVLDNMHCRFEPHVALLRTGQPLLLKNSDPVGHNTNVQFISGQSFNMLIPANGSVEQQVARAEAFPGKVACNIHPWMTGYLFVRDDPYLAISDKDGKFELKNVPAGEHEFQLWQEKAGYLGQVTIGGDPTDPAARGRITLEVKAEELDLGEIKVSPDQFKDR
ncbi:MAG: hypothetical protein WDZ59_02550 [Pirellulales bacterium]